MTVTAAARLLRAPCCGPGAHAIDEPQIDNTGNLRRRPVDERSPPHFPNGRPHVLEAPRPRRVNLHTARLPE